MLVLQIKNSQMPNSVIRLTILRKKNNMNACKESFRQNGKIVANEKKEEK